MFLLLSLLLSTVAPATTGTDVPPQTEGRPVTNEWETGRKEILLSSDSDVEITLYPDSYVELPNDIQQIGFAVSLPAPSGNKDARMKVSGLLQIQCDTQKYRHINSRTIDENGVVSSFPGKMKESEWGKLNRTHDDRELYKRLCGTNKDVGAK